MPAGRNLGAAPLRWLRASRTLLPGLALTAGVAAVAYGATEIWQTLVGSAAAAVLIGALVATAARIPDAANPGLDFATRRLLRLGIVLLGARFGVAEVTALGGSSAVLIVICLAVALGAGYVLIKRWGKGGTLGMLIVLGTAICGNSAVMAAAPILRAHQREVTYAVIVITLFGLGAVAVYPVVGSVLALEATSFGLWSGTAINDTAQVLAAGYAYETTAGDTATVVKLIRNLFIAPVLIGLALQMGRAGGGSVLGHVRAAVPLFVAGFLGMAIARSVGLLDVSVGPAALYEIAAVAASTLLLLALSAVGLQTKLHLVRELGLRPLLLGFTLSLLLASVSLALIVTGLGR